jgi:hypothetical protein
MARQDKKSPRSSPPRTRYERPGRYIVAVKVLDIFGSDTMTLVPVNVG